MWNIGNIKPQEITIEYWNVDVYGELVMRNLMVVSLVRCMQILMKDTKCVQ